jgi:hypothetical protein
MCLENDVIHCNLNINVHHSHYFVPLGSIVPTQYACVSPTSTSHPKMIDSLSK